MKLDEGRISIFISDEGTTIEIIDKKASTTFCRVRLTPLQLSQALSRMSHTECEIEVGSLDTVGKTHENKRFEFEIPHELRSSKKSKELTELCIKSLNECDMSEWIPDGYFGSQNSFSGKGDKDYANAVIRRWI